MRKPFVLSLLVLPTAALAGIKTPTISGTGVSITSKDSVVLYIEGPQRCFASSYSGYFSIVTSPPTSLFPSEINLATAIEAKPAPHVRLYTAPAENASCTEVPGYKTRVTDATVTLSIDSRDEKPNYTLSTMVTCNSKDEATGASKTVVHKFVRKCDFQTNCSRTFL